MTVKPSSFNMFILRILILTLCLSSFFALSSQTLNPNTPISEYQNTLWSEMNNIQIQRVFDIAQDSLGYIWIGSDRGLLRFDGTNVLPYTYKEYPILKNDNVRFVEIGDDNIIWVINRRGVYYLKDNEIKEVKVNDEPIAFAASVVLDKNQKLWITNRRGKLYTVENFKASEIKYFKDWVYKTHLGIDKSVWITTGSADTMKLWRVNKEGEFIEKKLNGFIPGFFQGFSINKKGTIAIQNSLGDVYTVIDDELKHIYSPKKQINFDSDVIIDDDEVIWFGGEGLQRIYKGKLESFTEDEKLGNNSVRKLLFDKDGNLWVGTEAGLNYFSESPFKFLQLADRSEIDIKCFLKEDDKIALVGSKDRGLLGQRNGVLYEIEGLESIGNNINSLLNTNVENEYLVGSTKGLFRIRKSKGVYDIISTYSSNNIKVIYRRKNGNICFAEVSNKNFKRKREVFEIIEGVKHKIKTLDGLIVTVMLEDNRGVFLVGTTEGLFYSESFDENHAFKKNELLQSKHITGLAADVDSNIWVGTMGSGLVKINKDSQEYFDTRKGLPTNQALNYFSSNKKGLWFWVPNRENGFLKRIVNEKINGEEVFLVAESFEMTKDISTSGISVNSGIIYFNDSSYAIAGNNAVVKFSPLSLKKTEPIIELEKLFINEKEVNTQDFKQLEAEASDFEFHYSSLDFVNKEQQYFEYKLEGYDQDWHHVGNRRVAYYLSLPAGEYSLRIRVKTIDEGFVEMKTPFQFSKKEFWWRTKTALFLYLIGFVGVIGFFFQWRINTLNKQKAVLKLKVDERTIELKELNENLEHKVEQRTQKIVEINNSLKESDERYKYALDASNDGIWDYNVKNDSISFSPAIYTMLGYEPYEFPETRGAIYKLMHSEEMGNEEREKHNLFISKNNQDFILDEYKMVNKLGKIIWIQVKGKVVEKDNSNKPLRIVGTHSDITASKLKNQEMLEAVLKTEDTERSRISKDIHDGLQQTLTISLLNFQSVKKEIKGLASEVKEKFDLGWKYLQESITESRTVAHTLMPKAIVDFGIVSAFESLIDSIDRASENTTYSFHHNFKTEKLKNQQIEITFYRILQEAINNINKYAKATNVDIQLKEYDDVYMLTIEDNGVGFDSSILREENKGLGFKSMKNRLDAINGFLEVDSRIGKGTSILVEINKS